MPYSLEKRQQIIKELNEIFFSLHNHSDYSNLRMLDSTNKISKMIKYVAKLGQHGFALTDHEALGGHLKFIKAVKELKESGDIPEDFKAILGNEIYLIDEQEMRNKISNNERVDYYHFILLAKDSKGHEYLRKLSSKAWIRLFNTYGMERVPTTYNDFDEVVEEQGHLIGSTACLGSRLSKLVTQLLQTEDEDEQDSIKALIDDFITWCIDMFGKDDFYIEIQPHNSEEQRNYNQYVLKIAKAYDLKHIITTDAHYLSAEDRLVHKAFLTSSDEGEGNREVDEFYESTYFMNTQELFERLDYLNDEDIINGIKNTKEIADKITDNYDLFHNQQIPVTPIPDESTWYKNKELYNQAKEYEYINQMIESEVIYDRYLINLTLEGLTQKTCVSKKEYPQYFERINIECKQILGISKAKGEPVSAYFTTMVKNIDIIWEEAQSFVMPGRGSSGGYVINYLIGIVQVDALKQGVEMPYFRFIHKSKIDYPDIDMDTSAHKKNKVFTSVRDYYRKLGGDVVRLCTFGTVTAKSAIQTACRGLGINSDIGLYLSSLIPVERGKVWSLSDCYYGNFEKNRARVTEFYNIINKYENLLEVAMGVEGLIDKRSSHACGIAIVNHAITDNNAIMRTPSGELVTQFELHDSEEMGIIKYDFLCTKACSKIQITAEMLIKDGYMKWQGSLRDTYNKYLHPDVLDKTTSELWDKLNNGELLTAFQFDSQVGEQALKIINPTSLIDATNANDLMRLMAEEGKPQPMELYARNKKDISLWYQDMKNYGLNDKEIEVMKKHLEQDYGVCSSQERMMLMSMDENIAGFNVPESNILRKGVAKKIGDIFEKAHKLFYEKGINNGVRKILLDYVWEVQIAMQRGYGFSIIHGVEYTYILIQELNLITYFPPIYWNTAVLLVESGALEQEDTEDDEIDSNKKEKSTQYGKMATAISLLQDKGIKVSAPEINHAELGFSPNAEDNEIIYGLKGIMKLNSDMANKIIENKPFANFKDFYNKMVLTKETVTQKTGKTQQKSLVSPAVTCLLIKAGAFDKIENKPREEILKEFILLQNPPRKSLDAKTIDKLLDFGIIDDKYKDSLAILNFRKYLMANFPKYKDESSSIQWYVITDEDLEWEEYCTNFFIDNFLNYSDEKGNGMIENKDYRYNEECKIEVALNTKRKGSFEWVCTQLTSDLMQWVKSKECLNEYNKIVFENNYNEIALGSISQWEMEAMSYYYHDHELAHVDKEFYEIVNFKNEPEEPKVARWYTRKNNEGVDMKYPIFKLVRIVGTVLDRDKNKHLITLLTPDGVVTMKMYSGQFTFYDKQISTIDEETNKKVTLEKSWFTRGNKLMVTGFRRGDQFIPKKYSNSIYSHTIQLIEDIDYNGRLTLTSERRSEEDV